MNPHTLPEAAAGTENTSSERLNYSASR